VSRPRSLLVASLLLAACHRGSPAPAPSPAAADAVAVSPVTRRSPFPDGWTLPARAKRLEASTAVVTAGSVIASEVGRDILRQGGNAIDAAVATGFAMAVVDPEAGNIGGGGYMLIRRPTGEAFVLDYRERAPGAATRTMFVGPDGEPTEKSRIGHLAAGVPGSVAGMLEAHRRFGSLPLATLIGPAIALARDGFIVDSMRSARIQGDSAKLAQFPASARIFLPDGRAPAVGTRLVQRDLARTLEAIRDRGTDGFYRGWVADSIVAEMTRGGGLITHADLEAYRPIWRDPLRVTYRGHTVIGAPPSASGGVTMGMMLNVLEAGGPLPPFGSAGMLHLYAETMRRAFVLRNRYVADPGFRTVPVPWLLSSAVADSLRRGIDPLHATPTPALSSPGTGSTTHYSIVDAQGTVVATTTTVNDLYGCGVTVSGAGFLLNDEMDDFSTNPDQPNSWGLVDGSPNIVEPGKRPLSSMTPTIVLDPQERPLLVLGSRGGPTIMTQVLQVVVNVIDHHMGLVDAVAAPRVHHQALPDRLSVDRDGFLPVVLDSLTAMGHTLRPQNPGGDVEAIMRTPKGWIAVSDPRSAGGPAGY
jgi:gamma-glutamyltranspeptidase/glutathione hydrolase